MDRNFYDILRRICELLRELSYALHMEFLRRGDEVKAIQIFEEFYLPFDRMAATFKALGKSD